MILYVACPRPPRGLALSWINTRPRGLPNFRVLVPSGRMNYTAYKDTLCEITGSIGPVTTAAGFGSCSPYRHVSGIIPEGLQEVVGLGLVHASPRYVVRETQAGTQRGGAPAFRYRSPERAELMMRSCHRLPLKYLSYVQ